MSTKNNTENDWSKYWQQGHKTSFGHHFSENYDGVIKDEWQTIFSDMDSNSAVLDLCTGNASLIRLALAEEKITKKSHCYTGVDYAQITVEQALLDLSNVNFNFGIDIEKLPFDDASFNVVFSNYGIEYSDIKKSIPEVARVLSKGGKVSFICHHIDSIVIKNSIAELEILEYLLAKGGAIDALFELINSLIEFGVGDQTEKFRQKLNQSIAVVLTKFGTKFYEQDFVKLLKYVMTVTSHDEKLEIYEKYRSEADAYLSRVSAMISAALTKESLVELKFYAEKSGFVDINKVAILDKEGLIAYKITMVK